MTDLQRAGDGGVCGKPDLHTGKLLEQAGGRFDLLIDARLDIGGANPVAVPVLKRRKRNATRVLRETETDGGTARDGLSPGKGHSPRKEPCGGVSARVIGR